MVLEAGKPNTGKKRDERVEEARLLIHRYNNCKLVMSMESS